MDKTLLVIDPIYQKHLTGAFHPESPLRIEAILEGTKDLQLTLLKPRIATEEEILYCHTKEYLEIVKEEVKKCRELGIVDGSYTLRTGDTQICPDSYEVALYAAGGVLTAIDLIMEGKGQTAFAAVRPPGHHATPSRGMGFCLFNNIAIGAYYLKRKYQLSRILIVDWDVHHGNGTEEIFRDDPSIFYFSTHELGNYPGTGIFEEKNREHILNCPIVGGKGSRLEIIKAFEEKLVPQAENFKPEFVLISCGFDGHFLDPMGGFDLTEEDYYAMTEIVKKIAAKSAEGRIVSVLEGGYHSQALGACAMYLLSSLSLNGE